MYFVELSLTTVIIRFSFVRFSNMFVFMSALSNGVMFAIIVLSDDNIYNA